MDSEEDVVLSRRRLYSDDTGDCCRLIWWR